MNHKTLTLALVAVLALVGTAAAQRSGETAGFEMNPDGSLVVDGLFYGDTLEWQLSKEFKASGRRCASPELHELTQLVAGKNPADCSFTSTTIQSEYNPGGGTLYRIPVVFHVISRTDGTGNIADSLITSQIDILNEDFRAIAGTLGAPGTDTRIEFFLATEDPNGNATTGITRTTSNAYFTDPGPGAFNDMKQALNWDTTRYLNIYSNDAAGNLGYATFPQQDAGAYLDGVVLLHTSVGRNNAGRRHLQPGPHRHPRGRALPRPVPHLPERLRLGERALHQRRPDRRHQPRQSAPNFNCPSRCHELQLRRTRSRTT